MCAALDGATGAERGLRAAANGCGAADLALLGEYLKYAVNVIAHGAADAIERDAALPLPIFAQRVHADLQRRCGFVLISGPACVGFGGHL